jgi:hypothetical protein
MSLFDSYQKPVFSVVENIMGDIATWTPSNSGIPLTSLVLYKYPEQQFQVGDGEKYNFSPCKYSMEYYTDQFVGLRDAINNGLEELVMIKGILFYCKDCSLKFDGQTVVVGLEPKEL